MSEQEHNDHVWFREQIAAALAGGLDAAGRVRFETHATSCASCAAELASMKDMENRMNGLFALPAGGIEDRIIARLRETRPRRLLMTPAVERAAEVAVAALILGVIGAVVMPPLQSARRTVRKPMTSSTVATPTPGQAGETLARNGARDLSETVPALKDGGLGAGDRSVRFSGGYAGAEISVAGKPTSGGKQYWDHDDAKKRREASGPDFYLRDSGSGRTGGGGGGTGQSFFGGSGAFKPTALGRIEEGKEIAEKLPTALALAPGIVAESAPAAPPAPEQPAQPQAGAVVENAPVASQEKPPAAAPDNRKVIRNGQMEFEVDRFDAAFAQVSKLTQENGGYVGTTDSQKLPNGKMRGTVILRVPPDRLDTLVLQLRGIGDLKSQKLEAQDISKQYTDLESELRAAKAMEERLLQIIKEGKGAIKDLLAAEKELGTWREKVEKITGEMRYYDNLVSLSTLHVTLMERDIQAAAKATETETIDAGVETVDVEKARAEALKAIEEAKGRVIQSDLKRYDAGQFGATIVAEVPPDASGALLDRIRQIGKVARLDIQRKQQADSSDNTATNAPPRVEKRDTRLNLSLYNLANVAPRQNSVATIAADDVEGAYQAILARVTKAGGRIVTSNVARNKPDQTSGTVAFEVPSAEAEAVTNDLRALGEVMNLSMTENPDVNNVTTAKRGFNVSLVSSAAVAPRETTTIQIASADVTAAREKVLAAATAGGARVLASQLSEKERSDANATIEIDVKRAALPAVEKALAEAGDAVSRSVSRSSDTENTIDSKVKLAITLMPAEKLPPREVTSLTIELSDVESAMAKMQQSASDAGGRVTEQNLSKQRDGSSTGKIAVEVPLDKASGVLQTAKDLGAVRAVQSTKNQQVPAGALARARIDMTFGTSDTIVDPGTGVWATIRDGLSTSVAGLFVSLKLIIIGLCFVLPWGLILWAAWKLIKRRKPAAATT